MPLRRYLGLFSWLALIALLALSEAMGTWGWEVPVFTLTVLSLPATVWGCLSRPVRGRPGLGFVLGLLNYLAFPFPFKLIIKSLVTGRLPHGWVISVAGLIAFAAPYALGAALVAGSRENWISDERPFLGLTLALTSWFLTFGYFFD